MISKINILLYITTLFFGNTHAWAEDSQGLERATFSMYCYWTGEAALGALSGVKRSNIGSLDGKEVVEVFYDPKETNVTEMVQALKKRKSFYSLLYRTPQEKRVALASLSGKEMEAGSQTVRYIEAKHSLKVRFPDIYPLDLSEEQALRLNSWAHFSRGPMPQVLIPEQFKQLGKN